jgi:hypothetical protein
MQNFFLPNLKIQFRVRIKKLWLQTENTDPNHQQDSTTMNTNSTKQLKIKIEALRAIGHQKVYKFFCLFRWSLVQKQKLTRRHMIIPHEQSEIWYHLMRGWFLIFREVEVNRLMEISILIKKASSRPIETLQSLHHSFVGYQHVHTRVGLTKKAKFLQMQPRTQRRTQVND